MKKKGRVKQARVDKVKMGAVGARRGLRFDLAPDDDPCWKTTNASIFIDCAPRSVLLAHAHLATVDIIV